MKHLILIGYKSVGKSAIGRELAQRTRMNFIDLIAERSCTRSDRKLFANWSTKL